MSFISFPLRAKVVALLTVLFAYFKSRNVKRLVVSKQIDTSNIFPQFFESSVDGSWIFTRHWLPDGVASKCVVFLIHGFNEHSGRYEHVGRELASQGFRVFSLDHRGHGQSGRPGGSSDFGTVDGVVLDVMYYIRTTLQQKENKDLPFFVFGHSFGGQIASHTSFRLSLDETLNKNFKGFLLSAPLVLGNDIEKIRKSFILMKFCEFLNFALPNMRVGSVNCATLCRNQLIHSTYGSDVLNCSGGVPIKTAFEMMNNGIWLIENAKHFPSHLPVFIMHSPLDEMTAAQGSYEFFINLPTKDKIFHYLNDCHHEILNEITWKESLSKMVNWMNERH